MSTDIVKSIDFPAGTSVEAFQSKNHFTGTVIASHDWHFTIQAEKYPVNVLKADVYTGNALVKTIKKGAKHAILI